MAGEDYGYYSGLAAKTNLSDQIGDYQRHDLVMKQNKALAESKAALFANDLNYQNAANSFDHARIKSFADNKIKEIGKFYKENPDVLYNPDKLAILNTMKKELQDNDETLRGFASDASFKALNADLAEVAKNPQMHNQLAYQKLLEQKENYLKYGNQLGLEASQTEGFKPFVYTKPAEFIDLSKKGADLGNNFKDIKPVILKNGRSGAWQTVANEATLDRDAQAFYLEHKEQFDQQHGKDGLKVAKELIRSGIQHKFDWGNTNLSDQLAMEKVRNANELVKIKAKNAGGGTQLSAYVETILKPKRTATNPEFLEKTFGSKIKHMIVNDDGSVQIDNTGDVFNYNGDIQDSNYTEGKNYTPTGVKKVSGFVYKPLQWAIDNGIVNDPFIGDPKVDGSWANTASIIDDPNPKDGKDPQKFVKFKVSADVKGNDPSYQGKFDSNIETTQMREGFGVQPNLMGGQQFVDEVGNVFDANGKFIGKAQ